MLSMILPTYNERENINVLIESLFNEAKVPLEVIVIDDDSPDETWRVAKELARSGVKVIRRVSERGLASAIKKGLDESSGDIVGWMDADMSHPPKLIGEMLKYIDRYDIVIASRYAKGGGDNRSFMRVLTSRIINIFTALLFGFDVRDYDSGYIILRKSVLKRANFSSAGYGEYFIEFMVKCKKCGFKIKEVPYVFSDREKGTSKTASSPVGFIKLGSGYLWRVIKLRFGLA